MNAKQYLLSDSSPTASSQTEPPAPPPAVLLQRFLEGNFTDPHVCHWLSNGFSAWWRSHGTVALTTCLHLPVTAPACARVARDAWLRAAAYCLPAESRAAVLAREIERFKEAAQPTTIHRFLALAAATGASLPSSVRQVRNILTETDLAFDFHRLSIDAKETLMWSLADEKSIDEGNADVAAKRDDAYP